MTRYEIDREIARLMRKMVRNEMNWREYADLQLLIKARMRPFGEEPSR